MNTVRLSGDLMSDWGEYIFDGNPTNPADTGVAPFIDPVSGEYVFQVRNDSSLVARVVSTTNLLTGMWITNATFNMDVNDFAMGMNRSPITDGPQQFIKLLVNDVETAVTEVPGYRLLIGGLQGNGDFESGAPTSGPHSYEDTASWFNGSGSESENAVNDTQMNGCSQWGSHGGLPVDDRLMLNRAGYTVSAPGEVFSLRYEFGAGGGTANWNGDEVMYAYVCFVPVGVGAETTEADLTVLGSDAYSVNRALDGQWTTRVVSNLYTTSAADVGRTLYLGLEFEQGSGADLYPRIDVIQWEVNK